MATPDPKPNPPHPSPPPPNPQPDRAGAAALPNLARLLYVVGTLLAYGRHLAAIIEHRAASPGFVTIARWFGTTKLHVILAHLHRGLLRAAALEALLRQRAATGRDIVIRPPRIRTRSGASAAPRNEAADAPERRAAGTPHDPDHLPTPAEIEAEVRRRPYGRTIAAIACDFAVLPGLCTRAFWDALTDAVCFHDGNAAACMLDMFAKSDRFFLETEADPALQRMVMAAPLLAEDVLGFRLGETPPAGPGSDAGAATAPGAGVPVPEEHAAAPRQATGPPGAGAHRAA